MKKLLRPAWTLAVAVLLAAPAAHAQLPPPDPVPERLSRLLPVGRLAFLESWAPAPSVGALFQLSLGRTRVVRDSLGIPVTTPPRVYLHTLASGGIFRGAEDEWRPRAFGEAGVVVRPGSGAFTTWGVVAHGVTDPAGIGPGVRIEMMDNLGVVGGWTFYRGERDQGAFVSVDFTPGVLQLLR